MRTAKLNGSKIVINEINEQTKNRKFNCINPNCNCDVIVAAFDSENVSTYFRAKNKHVSGCYMDKLDRLGGGISRRKLTSITDDWTIEDIYNLVKTSELSDEVMEGLVLRDIEVSSRNEIINIDNSIVYYIIFEPTCLKNENGKGVIHGILNSKKITINLSEELELIKNPTFPTKNKFEILVVSKLLLGKKGRYLIFDARNENIELFQKI